MAEANQEERWNHTATLLAMTANANRDPKKTRAFKPADFHPIHQAQEAQRPPIKGDIRMLKQVFVDCKGKKK